MVMDPGKSNSDLYSVRQRSIDGSSQADVYQYDVLPPRFRAQVVHIWTSAIGPWGAKEEFEYDNFEEVNCAPKLGHFQARC